MPCGFPAEQETHFSLINNVPEPLHVSATYVNRMAERLPRVVDPRMFHSLFLAYKREIRMITKMQVKIRICTAM